MPSTDDPVPEDRWAVPQQVLDMPGAEARRAMLDARRIMRILARNGSELLAFLKKANEPEAIVRIWNVGERGERTEAFEQFLDETERLLFNFLGAVYARVEAYRCLIRSGLLTGDLFSAYSQRLQRDFSQDSLHNWLMRLRSYMVHHRLPISNGHLAYTAANEETTVTVTVEVKDLLASGKDFTGPARRYMDGKQEVDVASLVSAYMQTLKAFDDWFIAAYWSHHQADISAHREAWNAARIEAVRRNFGL